MQISSTDKELERQCMREKGSEVLIMHVKLYSMQHYLTSIATQVLQGCFYVMGENFHELLHA